MIRRFLHLGVILPQPGQLRPDRSNSYGLDALVSNVNTYAVNLDNLSQSGTNITLTGPQAVAGVVRLIGTSSGDFTVTLPPTPRLIDALGPTIPLDGTFAVEISVQNEDPAHTATLVAGDALTTINGTTTVAEGTRRIWLLTVGSPYDYTVCSIQNIGTFSASGGLPGSGTVTSVAQTVPIEFSVAGSPITGAGTLAISKVNETANTVWAGPTSGGAAQPTFRALTLADLPGGVGTGSVTSVAATVPVEFAISGSPITTSGTLAITKATESANLVWAGPTTGAPAQPTFRSLVAADLPASLNLNQTFATISNESATLANSRRLVAGTNVTFTDGGAGSTLTIAASGGSGGGTLQAQTFTANGNFVPPTGVTAVWISGQGGGGGGATLATQAGGSGGGAGEFCEMQPIMISGTVAVTIGTGGTGASAGVVSASGSNGGNTTFGSLLTMLGGLGALTTAGGSGGGPRGAAGGGYNSGPGAIGSAESPTYFGGSSGGAGSSNTTPGANGGTGGPAPGFLFGAAGGTPSGSLSGGGGGGASIKGLGGAGGNAGSVGNNAIANTGTGGGGSGATTSGLALAAGNGGSGWLTVFWVS